MASPRVSNDKPDTITQRFFMEGEEHEANNWKNARFEDQRPLDPRASFTSFDRIPRSRTPLVATVALVAIGIGGLGIWGLPESLAVLHSHDTVAIARKLIEGSDLGRATRPVPAEPVNPPASTQAQRVVTGRATPEAVSAASEDSMSATLVPDVGPHVAPTPGHAPARPTVVRAPEHRSSPPPRDVAAVRHANIDVSASVGFPTAATEPAIGAEPAAAAGQAVQAREAPEAREVPRDDESRSANPPAPVRGDDTMRPSDDGV